MKRKFIFADAQGAELLLPVTPESYTMNYGQRIETVNIHTLGDVVFAGTNTLSTISIDCHFPSSSRSYCDGIPNPPREYIETFQRWIDLQQVVRLVISGTSVNASVLIESLDCGERDGTCDIYATIVLREYRQLKITQSGAQVGASTRDAAAPQSANTYIVVARDTLSAICRKQYGDSSASICKKLANYNGIKNPNVIKIGQVLKIPPKANL